MAVVFLLEMVSMRKFLPKGLILEQKRNIPPPVPSSYHSFGGWKDSISGILVSMVLMV